jgi:hypothetical protein
MYDQPGGGGMSSGGGYNDDYGGGGDMDYDGADVSDIKCVVRRK